MATLFADRLAEAVRQSRTALCVGIDPRWESLPKSYREGGVVDLATAASRVEQFCLRCLELVAPYCRVVKPQAAFFEWFGPAGGVALHNVLRQAEAMGFVTILDAKRGDIASTASAYADGAFDGITLEGVRYPSWNADALTVNPYLGEDAVEPFVTAATRSRRGVFVLVRTSNPGAGLFQDLRHADEPLYRHVARAVARWGEPLVGSCGLSGIGAVVGATHPRELVELRQALPKAWLLVPGYGAQGGTAADVRSAFRADGLGAIVNSSRGVMFPFHPDDPAWEAKVQAAAEKSANELHA